MNSRSLFNKLGSFWYFPFNTAKDITINTEEFTSKHTGLPCRLANRDEVLDDLSVTDNLEDGKVV